MSITRTRLLRYKLPLTAPIALPGGEVLETRAGLLLELRGDAGALAYGDIAPLPGWSVEDVAEAEAACVALLSRAPEGTDLEALPEVAGDAAAWHALPPSVRCGVSMALQRHWAHEEGAALYQFLCPFPRRNVPLAPLVTEDGTALEERLAALREIAPHAVKLKVGACGFEDDAARVRRAGKALGPGCALRLDANRAWDFDTAVAFAGAVRGCNIAYVEEPLAEPLRLPEFARVTELPYALDETAAPVLGVYFDVEAGRLPEDALPALGWRTQDFATLLDAAAAVVLKPTLVGEFGRLTLMARRIGGGTLRWVVSAAYESGVGVAALAQLAGALDEEDAPAGLGTYRCLAADVLRTRLPLEGARPELAAIATGEADVDTENLEVVWDGTSRR